MGPLTAASYRVSRLSKRQLLFLCRAAEGWNNARIGRAWGVAEGTVKQEMYQAYRALGVPDRTAAVVALVIAARRAGSEPNE